MAAWDAKFFYWTARPNQFDPEITTVLPTYPIPDDPSGHATGLAATAEVLSYLFPRDERFFQSRAEENAASRVWPASTSAAPPTPVSNWAATWETPSSPGPKPTERTELAVPTGMGRGGRLASRGPNGAIEALLAHPTTLDVTRALRGRPCRAVQQASPAHGDGGSCGAGESSSSVPRLPWPEWR